MGDADADDEVVIGRDSTGATVPQVVGSLFLVLDACISTR